MHNFGDLRIRILRVIRFLLRKVRAVIQYLLRTAGTESPEDIVRIFCLLSRSPCMVIPPLHLKLTQKANI